MVRNFIRTSNSLAIVDRSRDSTLNRPPCFNAFVASLDVLTIDAPCTRFDKERKREGERSKRFTMGIQFFGDDSVRMIKKKKERILKNVRVIKCCRSSHRGGHRASVFVFFFIREQKRSIATVITRHWCCAPTCVNLIFVRDRA